MDQRVYIFSFLCLIYTLCSCQGNPTICLEQGACYIGSWLSSSGNKRYQSISCIKSILNFQLEQLIYK